MTAPRIANARLADAAHSAPCTAAAERELALSALHSIPASCDRDTWIRVGMSAKSAGLTFDEFNDWSASAENYGGLRETLSVWNGFRIAGGITVATLFHVAHEHGWSAGAAGKSVERRVSTPVRVASLKPIPNDAPPLPSKHPQHGPPSYVWTYRNAEGRTLFHVCRFDNGYDRKVFVPLTFDGANWLWKGLDAPRPLYGLDRLAASPDATVIVCEGEKAADAASALMPDAVAITSPNGAQSARKADWMPLAGRRVILWPDFDRPGETFARIVAELIAEAGATLVGVIDVLALTDDRCLPDGWDAADALSNGMAPYSCDALPLLHQEDRTTSSQPPYPLDQPLDNPESIYHPLQMDWKKVGATGEVTFFKAKGTSENLARLIRPYGVRVRYNEMSRDVEISINGKLPNGDLARGANLSVIEDLCRINGYPYSAAAGHLDTLAAKDAYNPAMDWIKSRAWDGGEHIRALFDCLTLADASQTEISWTLFRKWFLGAVALLSGKTRKFEHVLVLVDPHGGIGKTRYFNTLCPKEFQADGVTLNPDDKDSVLHVASKWLVELGEIGATFNKSDIESLKAFLSRDVDELRPAYARVANRYRRLTAFFGSVNNVQFLVDDTNNRRFWPLQLSGVTYQHHIDVQQAWAEALHRIEVGESWHLNAEENRAIGEHNEGFRSKDRIEECILTMYDSTATPSRHLSASQVLDEIGVLGANLRDMRRAGTILRKRFKHAKRNNVVMYHMPPLLSRARHPMPVRNDYADGPL